MQIDQAIDLIKNETGIQPIKQIWADLGCGSGVFTKALANLLASGSIIYAIDKNKSALERIPQKIKDVLIEKLHGDFFKGEIPFNLDGIIMANSFHFVRNKSSFIKKIEKHLKETGEILIIEYDMDTPNPWVPFPISYQSLQQFFKKEMYSSIIKLKEHPSVFQRSRIYSALIKKTNSLNIL